jgi:putative transposase
MARQSRLVIPGVALHIVQRGVDRQDCFSEETDRLVYLCLPRELATQTRCAVHAYCLMTNHVHLLLTPTKPDGPSILMRKIGQRYVPYFNRRYGRTGTHIECNPVRVSMVANAGAYRWSSYHGNAGIADDVLLTPHVEYLALASNAAFARAAYRGLFDTAEDASLIKAIREATHGGYPLVGDALKRELARQIRRTLERGKPGPRGKATGDPVLTPN